MAAGKMKLATLMVLVLILSGYHTAAQERIQIQGVVVSHQDGSPLRGAHISAGAYHAVSRSDGSFRLRMFQTDSIHISYIGFESVSITQDELMLRKDTARLLAAMVDLPVVAISAKPSLVYMHPLTHVFDFEIQGDTILLLTYTRWKMLRRSEKASDRLYLGCRLVIASLTGSGNPEARELHTEPLPDFAQAFYRDATGRLFITGDGWCSMLELSPNKISINPIDCTLLEQQVMPVWAASDSHLFHTDYQWYYPEFNYFKLDKVSNQSTSFRTITEHFTMDLFRSEYYRLRGFEKLRCLRLEQATGIDKEVFGAYMTGFQYHPYYRPPYAPGFMQNDTLLIFDFASSYLYRHSGEGTPLDSIPLHCPDKAHDSKFAFRLLHDPDRSAYYAVYRKNGRDMLKRLDSYTGRLTQTITLYHPYPEQIKIRNQKAYYIYKPVRGDENLRLYCENLSMPSGK